MGEDSTSRRRGRKRAGKRPTMTDVAKIAGVSQSSVSLVLNEMSGSRISVETRARVKDAAVKIGYTLPGIRSEIPTRLGPERDKIAFVVDEISTSPHPVVSFDGVRDFAFEKGLIVSAYVTRSNSILERRVLDDIAKDPTIVGVIYATIFTRRVPRPEIVEDLPVVLLNCYTDPRCYMSVVPGEVAGGATATAGLVQLGHRRIGFINGEPWMDASIDRLKGYRQTLSQAKIPFDPSLVRSGDWLPQRGYEACLDLMSLDDPPTAIFCGNDLMALGAIEAARELGLRVPEDLSIMGYDDQELARYTNPPLSTVLLPNYEMGQKAASLLVDIALNGRKMRPVVAKVDGPLILRASTSQPRQIGDRARKT